MYFCYIDESGTSDFSDNSTHFVLVGLTIPVWNWKTCESDIAKIKTRYGLENKEIHTAWILRNYREQQLIPGFEALSQKKRRSEVEILRKTNLHNAQNDPKTTRNYSQLKKNYSHTQDYIHLSITEREALIKEIAVTIGGWKFARLFAECIDKIRWDQTIATQRIEEQSFEQIVSRFERYLRNLSSDTSICKDTLYGLIIHDNSPTVEKKHTELMKRFQSTGTLWTSVTKIIETPLFVNSELTNMVQIADVCAYAIRRYLEKNETSLFNEIHKRADRKGGNVVGTRHFPPSRCRCVICSGHNHKK
jgi:hypothetical protein